MLQDAGHGAGAMCTCLLLLPLLLHCSSMLPLLTCACLQAGTLAGQREAGPLLCCRPLQTHPSFRAGDAGQPAPGDAGDQDHVRRHVGHQGALCCAVAMRWLPAGRLACCAPCYSPAGRQGAHTAAVLWPCAGLLMRSTCTVVHSHQACIMLSRTGPRDPHRFPGE